MLLATPATCHEKRISYAEQDGIITLTEQEGVPGGGSMQEHRNHLRRMLTTIQVRRRLAGRTFTGAALVLHKLGLARHQWAATSHLAIILPTVICCFQSSTTVRSARGHRLKAGLSKHVCRCKMNVGTLPASASTSAGAPRHVRE